MKILKLILFLFFTSTTFEMLYQKFGMNPSIKKLYAVNKETKQKQILKVKKRGFAY